MFWKTTREDYINERVDRTVGSLTDGDFSDKEICDFILAVKNRSLNHLRLRRLKLRNDLEETIESITKLENNE